MTRYVIMPTRSKVWVEARSNVHPIHTEAAGLEGWLELDISDGAVDVDQALGHIEFPVENLTSGNGLEDREMHRRIDARRYPTITGDLKVMKQTKDPARYTVGGDLTFRGVTRAYEDEMGVASSGDNSVSMTGVSVFDIRDFGMEPPRILMFKVQPEVTVRVEIVAEKES
ncbi:MAG: YceI family protein [Ilumatobacteraceae bacterium]